MKNFLLATVLISGMGFFGATSRAADEKKEDAKSFTGTLIDNHCGEGAKDATAAAEHPKACAMKGACAKSGYQVIVGDKHMKFDSKGNELAMAYLKDADHTTSVMVEGTPNADGTELAVTAIKPGEKK